MAAHASSPGEPRAQLVTESEGQKHFQRLARGQVVAHYTLIDTLGAVRQMRDG